MVCFNLAGQVLLVSALGEKDVWVFPKGHIEDGEESSKAAEREVLEETGVEAPVTAGHPIGTSSFLLKEETVVVVWWSGLGVRRHAGFTEFPECGLRTVQWVHWRKAMEMLSFPELKDILKKALCIDVV